MGEAKRIQVLVVEYSDLDRQRLVRALEQDAQLQVIGAVADGQAAVDFVARRRPDVILMDVHMPRMDGFEATSQIMQTYPVPIVVCSGTADVTQTTVAFQALEAGAIACVEKPFGPRRGEHAARLARLVETLKLMSEVKVVRRRPALERARVPLPVRSPRRAVGIGASTGGPPVLQTLLSGLPKDFAAPVLVVQHIARGFLPGMVEWLAQTSALDIHIAQAGVPACPGHVYIAPDDYHLGLGYGGELVLSRSPPENHVRPAVSFLFRSLRDTCGAGAIGVLLTGMGRDGAKELKALRDRGAATIAQDEASSVIHGMPGLAIALGGAAQVLPPERIADALVALLVSRP